MKIPSLTELLEIVPMVCRLPFTVYQNKKLHPSHVEVELRQRAGQLAILSLVGRGTPISR